MAGQKSTSSSGEYRITSEGGVALGFGDGPMSTVRVVTKQGSEYIFPDMGEQGLRTVLPPSGRIPEGAPILMMVNASMAVLNIPFRVVKSIYINGEEVWACSLV